LNVIITKDGAQFEKLNMEMKKKNKFMTTPTTLEGKKKKDKRYQISETIAGMALKQVLSGVL